MVEDKDGPLVIQDIGCLKVEDEEQSVVAKMYYVMISNITETMN